MDYAKDNLHPGHHLPNANYPTVDKGHFIHQCKENAGKYCEIEMADGKVYEGKIHSHDHDHVYLIMHMHYRDSDSERIFPGFGFGFGGFPGFGFGFPFFAGPFGPGFGRFGFPFFGMRRFRRFW